MSASSQLERALADRDRAVELLQGSETRARRIIETAGDPFVSMGADGIVEAWNHAAEVTFGWQADEAIGRPLHELIIPPEQRAGHLRGLERMRAGGQASILGQTLELTALRRDGGEFPVELTVWAIDDDDRRSFNAFVRDISACREAAASTARLAAVVESSTDAILTVDPEGTVLSWNGGAEKVYGYRAEEMIGRNAESVLAQPGGESDREAMRDRLGRGLSTTREVALLRADGRAITAEVTSSPILDADGRLVAVSSISRDISEQKTAERALAASEERFRLARLHAPIGLSLVGLDGRWLQVNPALCHLTGRTEKDLLGLTFSDITHPDDRAGDFEPVEQLLRGDISSFERATSAPTGRLCTS